ncbi:hypothetical protein WN943_022594 [Citrus x changshan-huyou]
MESTCIKLSLMSLIWIIVLMNEIHGYKACLETERTALLEIKSFFISVSDIRYDDYILPSWVGEDDGMPSDCCDDWEGVMCNATTRRVMQLSLNNTKILNYYDRTSASFLINMSLFHPFEELQSLDLSDNWFTGIYENRAYDSFGILKQLKILKLGFNFFNDNILPYLNTLTSLTTLNLGYNKIEGSRTKQGLANLRYLQVLDLSWNFNITSGSLTRLGLANLTNLKKLGALDCRITAIQGLANLTNLQVLDLSGNQNLTTLGLANLPNLKTLDLRDCGITTIQGLVNLTNLQVLDLSYNENLTTLGICELKNLFELNLRGNNFKGHLLRCLNSLTYVKVLDISSNQLSGILPSVIANLTSLEYFAMPDNKFKGRLFSFCSLANFSKLEVFQLSMETDLLQVETENCLPTFQLKVLSLPNCNLGFQLTGAQHGLLRLDISSNSFTGKLPQNMGIVLLKLVYMNISKHSFEGNIPSSIGKMQGLRFLDASTNNFAG